MGIDQYPRQNFFYARRLKFVGSATTPNTLSIPNSQTAVIWNKNIISGALSYDNTTGILTITTQTDPDWVFGEQSQDEVQLNNLPFSGGLSIISDSSIRLVKY